MYVIILMIVMVIPSIGSLVSVLERNVFIYYVSTTLIVARDGTY